MELIVISQNVCSGCRALEGYLSNEYPEVEYNHINIDEDYNAIEKYNVKATPTIILWDSEEQEELTRVIGFDFNKGTDSVVDELIEQL